MFEGKLREVPEGPIEPRGRRSLGIEREMSVVVFMKVPIENL